MIYNNTGMATNSTYSSWCVLYANSFSVLMENVKGIEQNCFREKSFPFSRNFIAYHFVIKKEEKKEIYTSELNKANSYSSIYNLVYDFIPYKWTQITSLM